MSIDSLPASARRRLAVATFTALASSLLACGEKPDAAKLEMARQTVRVAEETGAATWAPEALAEARQALDAAEGEYQKQERALRRNAARAHSLATSAADLASQATTSSVAVELAAGKEARAFVREAETLVAEAEGSLARLVRCRPSDSPVGLRQLAADLETVRAAIADANNLLDNASYREVIASGLEMVTSAQALRDGSELVLRRADC
jgi:hypothetical protein